jgi:hypothetical protein
MTAGNAQAARAAAPSASTELPVLRACLETARRRARAALVLRGAVLVTVAALALLCGLELFAVLFEGGAAVAIASPLGLPLSAQALCLAIFIGALALAVVLAFALTPDPAALARAAERAFALRERLSTALEVEGAAKPHGSLDPIRSALLDDAERHAAGIDPRQIVRLRWPRAGFAIPVLVAAAVMLLLMPPEAIRLAALGGRAPAGLTAQQSAAAAANLRRIAEVMAGDADQSSDQYLRSIARSLERLSADVEHAAIDRQQLAHRLESLVAHARQAYGQGSNPDGRPTSRDLARRDLAGELEAALADIAGNRGATADARGGEDAPRAADAAAAAEERKPAAAQSPQRRTAGVQPPAEFAPADRRAAGRDAVLKDLDDYDVPDPRVEKERAFAEQQRRARAAVQSVGGARDAGQGDGDRAGEGTRPLGNGATAPNELAPGAQMLLPDRAAGDGRHIRIELPPETSFSVVAPPQSGVGGAWRRLQEQAIEREALASADRQVVGRYFARPKGSFGP